MTHRVNDVGRCHLGDHGHDVDQSNSLTSDTCRHDLHGKLEPDIHGVRREESSSQEHYDLDNPQI